MTDNDKPTVTGHDVAHAREWTPPAEAVEAARWMLKESRRQWISYEAVMICEALVELVDAYPAIVAEKDAEIERLRDPLRPPDADEDTRAAWTTGWRSFDSMSRKSAITTCHALVDMRDRAIRRYEIAEEKLSGARAKLAAVAALADAAAQECRDGRRTVALVCAGDIHDVLADHAADDDTEGTS